MKEDTASKCLSEYKFFISYCVEKSRKPKGVKREGK